MVKTIYIEGMACEHCVAHVTKALASLGGKNIQINLAEKTAVAELDASDEAIIAAIEEVGYDVTKFQ